MRKVIQKILKWLGGLIFVLLAMGLVGLITLYYTTEKWLDQVYTIRVDPLQAPLDAGIVERGRHIVTTRGMCLGCHGENLSGTVWDEGPLIGRLVTPNLTSGKGGIGAIYTDDDWVRAMRHGVNKEGKSLIAMPSEYFYTFNDGDLAAIIAYIRSLPPVDTNYPKTRLGPMGRFMMVQGSVVLPARVVDHDAPRPVDPPVGVNAEYGKYLANNCTLCHNTDFAGGGLIASGVNLTPGGEMKDWTEEDFMTALRTGLKPDGKLMNAELMPYPDLGKMTDDELKAIWLFLRGLPAIQNTPTPTVK